MPAWAIGTCIAANTIWICILAVATDRLNRRMRRDRFDRLKDAQTFAHDLDTLRKTQALEREWHHLARELAEADGKEAG